jgi:hypothetical protein
MLQRVVEAVAPPEGAGLIVATSSGAISGPFERWHREAHARGELAERWGWRQLPTDLVGDRLGLFPRTTVSVACASGTTVFELARGWLRAGWCERVVVAGVDALSLYIHAGFAGLGALAREATRPFGLGRDGLMLGEGAAAFLLETPASARAAGRPARATLLGVGLSQDGVHLTAPDRTGAGLARAIRVALEDAKVDPEEVGAVSAHATGTVFNDAMEARALSAVFDAPVPLHAAKPVIGHTLGAAGALEAALLLAILEGAEAPAPPTIEDPDCPLRVAPTPPARLGLSVNAAFGGINAAIVLAAGGVGDGGPHVATRTGSDAGVGRGPLPSPDASERVIRVLARASLSTDDLPLARVFPGAPPALGRADAYVRAGIATIAEVRAALAPDTAVVLSSASNCHAADIRYHAGLVAGGPAHASRLHFSYTIPGAPVAEASILLGLRGPVHVVCDDEERAHAEARRLVREGARTAVAVHVHAPSNHAVAALAVYGAEP